MDFITHRTLLLEEIAYLKYENSDWGGRAVKGIIITIRLMDWQDLKTRKGQKYIFLIPKPNPASDPLYFIGVTNILMTKH